MPNVNRDGYKEYLEAHIKNAVFFDLDKNSNQMTDLPHMLTTSSDWEKIVSKMGISKDDEIVVYDNSDVLSSCRCWYNFIYFGHSDKLIHVLNGGLKKWKFENKATTSKITKINPTKYTSSERKDLVKNKNEIKDIFKKTLGDNMSLNVVFSCGSGVTASVLALAYSLINNKYMPIIYDGSWAEYGRI